MDINIERLTQMGSFRGCTCLKCTNKAKKAPMKQDVHQQSKMCTNKAKKAPMKQVGALETSAPP